MGGSIDTVRDKNHLCDESLLHSIETEKFTLLCEDSLAGNASYCMYDSHLNYFLLYV